MASRIEVPMGFSDCVTYSADPSTAYVCSSEGGTSWITTLDLARGAVTGRIALPLRNRQVTVDRGTVRIAADGIEPIVVLADGSSSIQSLLKKTAGLSVTAAGGRAFGYVTTNAGNTIDVVSRGAAARSPLLEGDGSPNEIAIVGGTAYVSNSGGSVVTVVDLRSGSRVLGIPVGGGGYGIVADREGAGVYVANNSDGTLSLIDTKQNLVAMTIAVGRGPECLALAPDGRHLYVDNVNGNSISVVDTATHAVITTFPLPGGGGRGLAVAPDGQQLLVPDGRGIAVLSVG